MLSTDDLKTLLDGADDYLYLDSKYQIPEYNFTYIEPRIPEPPFTISINKEDETLELFAIDGKHIGSLPNYYFLKSWEETGDMGFTAVFQSMYGRAGKADGYTSFSLRNQPWDERSGMV